MLDETRCLSLCKKFFFHDPFCLNPVVHFSDRTSLHKKFISFLSDERPVFAFSDDDLSPTT